MMLRCFFKPAAVIVLAAVLASMVCAFTNPILKLSSTMKILRMLINFNEIVNLNVVIFW
jgi:hypothetical protein